MPRGALAVSGPWPAELVLVRHGESVGNVADAAAQKAHADRLTLDYRDADTPLSEAGERQADAVGEHLAARGSDTPDVIVTSPYERAAQTAARAVRGWGHRQEVIADERLRERDLGLFDGMTGSGIRAEYADEAKRRAWVGKFYYRPPSGESWCDVALRVRSLLVDLRAGYADQRVWLFTHQAVIMAFRYVLENLTEQELLEIDRTRDLPNCSITTYKGTAHGLELVSFADPAVVSDSAAPQTTEPSRSSEGSSEGSDGDR
ncbi:histidine phosphatase family protein [Pedococcus sp. 5OH_020]|uniref:histidine phosphatase family protein n=1 Tax=Pedococcus sp. 5OH_020 TaxID=2989814 RepID=UPI0022E9B9F8|nr:histidine phosphatase family protein [Pedococcus sp. 5OH_020]